MDYSVEIPNIQRDYTYGRESAKPIRKKLIKDIINAISIDNSSLHLDFVYGRLKGVDNFKLLDQNEQSIKTLLHSLKNYAKNLHIDVNFNTESKNATSAEIITFIPLDGQQRLTTLFLIHWFLAKKTNNKEALEQLNRFTYATRNSSRDFLKMLYLLNFDLIKDSNALISEIIETNELFFTFWKKDPTVNSMLIVLDEINKTFTNIDLVLAWEKLTITNTVTFDFFDLEDFEQTDELYVKMNARGKELTHFENFKAWLMKTHSDKITIPEWRKKLDIHWNDLFWNAKSKNATEIDQAYLIFFKRIFLGDFVLQNDLDKINANSITILRENKEDNPLDVFEKDKNFTANINEYIRLLAYCETINNDYGFNIQFYDKTFNTLIFNDQNSSTWWSETLYFAVTRYIIINEGNVRYFKEWIRIVSNLIYNTPIESPKLYKEACQSVLKLIKRLKGKSIYEEFSVLNSEEIDFFLEKQVLEEIKKAKLIVADKENKWEPLLISLENHTYFYGQIDFIFDFVRTENSFKEFKEVSNKIAILFSEKIMKEGSYLLFRAFLSQKQCFFISGNNYTYPFNTRSTLRNRNENWRRFISNNIDVVKLLIDNPLFDKNSIIISLDKIIKEATYTETYTNCIANNSELLNYPPKNHIKKYDNAYYLLNSTKIYGYYVELYTYDWFLKNKLKYENLKYQYGIKEENLNNTGIKINNEILIFFAKKKGCFKIQNDEDREFVCVEDALIDLKIDKSL